MPISSVRFIGTTSNVESTPVNRVSLFYLSVSRNINVVKFVVGDDEYGRPRNKTGSAYTD